MMNPASAKTLNLFGEEVAQSQVGCLSDKVAKIIATRKRNTQLRNERITTAFNHKYNVERKRYDDVIAELCEEFALEKRTIESALKS